MTLTFENFKNDSDFLSGKKLVLETLAKHQKSIQEVRGPQKELTASYEKTLKDFGEVRGGNLYYPYLSSGMGNGPLIELGDGSIKYDMIIGIGVHIFGHSHPKVIEACLEAALEDTVMQGNLQQNYQSYKMADLLVKAAQKNGAKLKHCFMTSSGVMAGENALKLAFHKHQPADRVIVFEKCFMGRTLAISQMTDKPAYRNGLPLNFNVDYVPFFDAKDPAGSTERAVTKLKELIARYPGKHAAMSFELIQGEGGFYPGDRDFFLALIKVLKENNIAVLFDEVQSFSRTPSLYAFQHFGLDEYADIVWVGKASQICATLYTEDYKPKPGLLSQTFTSSTTAMAAGHAIVSSLLDDGYLGEEGRIKQLEKNFHAGLKELEGKHTGKLEGPFGLGSMVGFTLFGGDKDKTLAFLKELFQDGVISFAAGANPTRARFLLPVGAMTDQDVGNVLDILDHRLAKY
jgi:acetylornithine/N-succinyldiaminopimelate aminotransferase